MCSLYYKILEELKLEPVTLEFLKKEKGFKPGKKHQKELDAMRKKHMKERQTMQKNHCSAIEKLTKGKECVYVDIFYLINNSVSRKRREICEKFVSLTFLAKIRWRKTLM